MNWLERVFAGEGFCFLVVGGGTSGPKNRQSPWPPPRSLALRGKPALMHHAIRLQGSQQDRGCILQRP